MIATVTALKKDWKLEGLKLELRDRVADGVWHQRAVADASDPIEKVARSHAKVAGAVAQCNSLSAVHARTMELLPSRQLALSEASTVLEGSLSASMQRQAHTADVVQQLQSQLSSSTETDVAERLRATESDGIQIQTQVERLEERKKELKLELSNVARDLDNVRERQRAHMIAVDEYRERMHQVETQANKGTMILTEDSQTQAKERSLCQGLLGKLHCVSVELQENVESWTAEQNALMENDSNEICNSEGEHATILEARLKTSIAWVTECRAEEKRSQQTLDLLGVEVSTENQAAASELPQAVDALKEAWKAYRDICGSASPKEELRQSVEELLGKKATIVKPSIALPSLDETSTPLGTPIGQSAKLSLDDSSTPLGTPVGAGHSCMLQEGKGVSLSLNDDADSVIPPIQVPVAAAIQGITLSCDDADSIIPPSNAHHDALTGAAGPPVAQDHPESQVAPPLTSGQIVQKGSAPSVVSPVVQGHPPGSRQSLMALVETGAFEDALNLMRQEIALLNVECMEPLLRKVHQERSSVSFQAALDKVREGYQFTTQGKFQSAMDTFRSVLASLPLVVAQTPEDEKEIIVTLSTCRSYVQAMKMEANRKALGADDVVRRLQLTSYLSRCALKPEHQVLTLRVAMSSMYKVNNFASAAGIAKRLLEDDLRKCLAEDAAAQVRKCLQMCEQRPGDAYQIDSDASIRICSMTLTPIPRDAEVITCPYCKAEYALEHRGALCDICHLSEVGAAAPGLQIRYKTY
eukprot:gnl/MRDRNA2_/MRDRNA2_115257_c0_seq1.p1 gnl/MRDRNA2_/MRDRNA2_115257_c0~~gnl/MRDRNA2_/MRDRNA2_115257_c0_seq1.p1  ORF type:complete len:780 (+),score=176.59 gnl/MRDRNA2_/MRDRNA2_115257_c0_seq1:76-2340(+)